jgi:hypothetical protein
LLDTCTRHSSETPFRETPVRILLQKLLDERSGLSLPRQLTPRSSTKNCAGHKKTRSMYRVRHGVCTLSPPGAANPMRFACGSNNSSQALWLPGRMKMDLPQVLCLPKKIRILLLKAAPEYCPCRRQQISMRHLPRMSSNKHRTCHAKCNFKTRTGRTA